MEHPIISEHPALWNSAEIARHPDWDRPLAPPGTPESDAQLKQVQHDLEHGSGACILRGFPVDDHDLESAQATLLAMCEQVGTPLSQSADGDLVFSVRDAGLKMDDPRARGPNTRKKLSFHADRCDVIAFLCLQPAAEGGENDIVSSMLLYNELARNHPDLLTVLMEPFYYARHTVDLGNENPWCQQPVFSFTAGRFACNLLRVLIDRAAAMEELPDLTHEQIEALDLVQSLSEDPARHHRFRLARGDILMLNNWVTLHRRTAFVDDDDEALHRHILRVWLSVPNSRPLNRMFKDNYGAVGAGAVRGGMRAKVD